MDNLASPPDSGNTDAVTVQDILVTARLTADALGENPAPEAYGAALRAVVKLTNEARLDPFQVATVRAEAAGVLRLCKVSGVAGLVSAAFKVDGGTAADGLQGRAVALVDPEPWENPVDGSEVLSEVSRLLARHLYLPEGAATAITLWVAFAYSFRSFVWCPLLNIRSPEKQCGKSTLLSVLNYITPRALLADGMSPAALFRLIEAQGPTMLLDEADAWMRDNEELRGIINSGHRRSGQVFRCAGDDQEVRGFSVWCPKAVAGIGDRADTILDRSVSISLQRAPLALKPQPFREDLAERGALEPLRQRLARFSADITADLEEAEPFVPEGLPHRAADNWRPLLAIAEAAGGKWPEYARRAALILSGAEKRKESFGEMLLADIESVFDAKGADRLHSEVLAGELARLEERPWADYKAGKPITVRQLASKLEQFHIKSKQMRIGTENRKGYELGDFREAFARYLPPSTPFDTKHPQQSSNGAGFHSIPGSKQEAPCFGSKNPENPRQSSVVSEFRTGTGGGGAYDDAVPAGLFGEEEAA